MKACLENILSGKEEKKNENSIEATSVKKHVIGVEERKTPETQRVTIPTSKKIPRHFISKQCKFQEILDPNPKFHVHQRLIRLAP